MRLMEGDCRDILPQLATASVDVFLADPPYPEISRPYGRMSEAEWHEMMRIVVSECRRTLKPKGSAVFIIQPNSECLGRMRSWPWKFMEWVSEDWNVVQDVYWWNLTALPVGGVNREWGLMRPSVKPCVWCGPPDCYRYQNNVLWPESAGNARARKRQLSTHWETRPSGRQICEWKMRTTAVQRNGTTPFNLIPIGNVSGVESQSAEGHPALTPLRLCRWWIRYICPVGGVVCDPFMGSGTVGIAALEWCCDFIGIEKQPEYLEIARRRIDRVL
jgi:DNA modification methylase